MNEAAHQWTALKAGASPDAAFVALGANLGRPEATLLWARRQLGALGVVVAASSLYRTAPVGGPPGQRDYLNAVVALDTALDTPALLRALLDIERASGRVRAERNGPRTLDLDVLARGAQVLDSPDLTVPHPRMMERAFVLAPLVEIAPDWAHPVTGERAADALARVSGQAVDVLNS